jgi:methyl-accepting chemotaxis protein
VTISRKLLSGFGALAAIMLVLGINSVLRVRAINQQLERVADRATREIEASGTVRYLVADLQAILRQSVIAAAKGDAGGARSAIAAARASQTRLDETAALLSSGDASADVKRRLADIRQAMRDQMLEVDKIEQFVTNGQALEAADASDRAKVFGERAAAAARDIVRLQSEVIATERASSGQAYRFTVTLLLVLFGVAIAASSWVLVSVRSVNRSLEGLTAQLGESAGRVLGAAASVAHSSQSLSTGAVEQAASLEETSASMEEMSSMTRHNAQNTGEVARLVAAVERQVQESNTVLASMVSAMTSIQDSSARVSRIIRTIDEIAFQTNILALNAAVEAARAGSAGMGFAVVADEVRSLAQRSAEAARDTAGLIEEASTKAREGGDCVTEVVSRISGITESMGQVRRLVDEVSQASRQQAEGITQVTTTLTTIERVTQATAQSAQESASASVELKQMAERAMQAVISLEHMTTGATTVGGGPTVSAQHAAHGTHAPAATLRAA